MPSPFPGMNPYLENKNIWHDFHERFIPVAAEEIGRQVQPAYIVQIDQNVYVHELPDGDRRLLGRPDVFVVEENRASSDVGAANSIALTSPTTAQIVPVTISEKDGFIEIQDAVDRKLITAVELLSPSNKSPGSDRSQYVAKRDRYLHTGVHLVEIDLLRGGRRMPLHPPPQGDYCVMVSRAEEFPSVGVWHIALREPLPTIPIPLHEGESARLDLQAVFNRVYEAAGYMHYIYKSKPEPPLSVQDQAWATELLRGISVKLL